MRDKYESLASPYRLPGLRCLCEVVERNGGLYKEPNPLCALHGDARDTSYLGTPDPWWRKLMRALVIKDGSLG